MPGCPRTGLETSGQKKRQIRSLFRLWILTGTRSVLDHNTYWVASFGVYMERSSLKEGGWRSGGARYISSKGHGCAAW